MSADEVKQIRAFLGLTQEELADALEVCLGTVRAWEQGVNKKGPVGPARVLLRKLFEEAKLEKATGQPVAAAAS